MRKIKLITLIVLFAISNNAQAQDTYVDGYYRDNGTYVEPHYRSQNDGNSYNNWSSEGNSNPYTGNFGGNDAPTIGSGGGENSFKPKVYQNQRNGYGY